MKKVAFVLSGGGAKGAFQLGVMKQLFNNGITPDVLIGTSVGSLNAAGYSYLGMDNLVKLWLNIKGSGDIVYPNGIQWLWNFWRFFFSDGFRSTKPLRKKLDSFLTGDISPICEAYACYIDLRTGKKVYQLNDDTEKFKDGVIASSCIPMLMESHHLCVDGGVRDHTPIEKAIELGATDIYVIICNPGIVLPWKKTFKLFPWYDILKRSIDDIMCHEILTNDIKTALLRTDVKIKAYMPDRWWMESLEFDPLKIRNAYKAGLECNEAPLENLR